MSYQASFVLSPEKYINNLEESANKDLFDPRQFTFDSNVKYLADLVQKAKGYAMNNDYDNAYIGFRRFQIILSCLEKHQLYDPEDSRIQTLNMVFVLFSLLPLEM